MANYLVSLLRERARNRQAQDALCYADGGIETNMQPPDYLEWKAADEIERLCASRERLKSAVEFAHAEGFQWPSDPMAEFQET